jgi:tripeptide aminopeptidase
LINSDRLLDTFLTICRIDSFHPGEAEVMAVLRDRLSRAGVAVNEDEYGNLQGDWPGIGDLANADPVLLCAHVDTILPTPGMEPVVRDGAVWSDGSHVLGADDKAAVAAIVEAIETIAESGRAHPPVEVLLTVGEEVGHIGSKAFDATRLKSRIGFVPDSDGPVGRIILASPWAQHVTVTFHGRGAHAGLEPENGRNALVMAARAVAALPWGRLDDETTANVGTISGGEAPNVVASEAEMTFEVRSLDETKHQQCIDRVLAACDRAAKDLDGAITRDVPIRLRGFRFEEDDPIVERAKSAIRAAGIEPHCAVSCGGSDANELNAKGLPTLVLSVAYRDIHSVNESMPLDQLYALGNVCAALMLRA